MAGFEPRDPDVNDRFGSAADLSARPKIVRCVLERTFPVKMSANHLKAVFERPWP